MKPHITYDDNDETLVLARVHPASKASVDLVLNSPLEGQDGRSDWCWIRLPNGDLFLGVFPQGDTYFAVEEDAQYPD
jgi:hypothetical protein